MKYAGIAGILLQDECSGRIHTLPEYPRCPLLQNSPVVLVMDNKVGEVEIHDMPRTDGSRDINGRHPTGAFVRRKRTDHLDIGSFQLGCC